jgi:hypothetical protein
MSLLRELACHLFGHREKSDKRPYLVMAADGMPHGETMLCITCDRCGAHVMDLGLSGVPWAQSREGSAT